MSPLRFFKANRSAFRTSTYTFLYLVVPLAYIRNKHYCPHLINGSSMSPFLSPDYFDTGKKDCVLFRQNVRLADDFSVKDGARSRSELERGMIVSFMSPTTGKLAVKRVVAIEGDVVRPLRKRAMSESGLAVAAMPEELTVPFGHVWVEGDQADKEKTLDSNDYGPISKSLIEGVATYVLWPAARRGRVEWEKDWEDRVRGRITRARQHDMVPEEWSMASDLASRIMVQEGG